VRLVSIAASAAAVLMLMACASASNPGAKPSSDNRTMSTSSGMVDDPSVPSKPNEVVIYQFIFKPKVIRVPVGTTITWVNHDIAAHTATRNGGADQFESGNLSYNRAFSHTFNAPGTYDYICFYHPGMKAQVIVTPSAEAAKTSGQ